MELSAGFVDRGEQVETAARREVREETGLVVELGPYWPFDPRRTTRWCWRCTRASRARSRRDKR
ncbi:MAG: NUDIX domain-containing protein [Chloroflexia bacterium]